LQTLDGEFDIIFVDANKDGYATYVQTILDRKLLSPNGIILCDNGELPSLLLYHAFHVRTKY
jgi:predicted O-methyltransferase YrrM